jgi:hypothetical protein
MARAPAEPYMGVRHGRQLRHVRAPGLRPRGRPLCAEGAKAEWPRPRGVPAGIPRLGPLDQAARSDH